MADEWIKHAEKIESWEASLNQPNADEGYWSPCRSGPELPQAIDACPSGHLTYLVTEYGKTFTGPGFGNWFADKCRMAGVPGRAHGLRKAGATILADNDATSHELMAIYGWADLSEAELYTRKANRKNLARSGMEKMRMR